MKGSDSPIPVPREWQGIARRHGQNLQDLYDEAARLLEPIFRDSRELGPSILMYRAMNQLQAHYPHLNEGELDALFRGLLKHRRDLTAPH